VIAELPPYPDYRDSGVPWLGEVPGDWEVVPARAVYRPKLVKNTGMVEKTVLSLSFGQIVVKPEEKLRGLVPESFETYQIVDPGNIIIRTTDLQNDQKSIRVGYSNHRGIITSAYMCLGTTGRVSKEFGYQFLNAYDLLKIIYGFGSGLRQNLDFGDIKQMPVLVPPPPDQVSIVRFLDHADRRIRRYVRAKRKLIKLLEEQKQAIVNRAVTRGLDPFASTRPSGVEWLGDVPAHWEVRGFTRCAVEIADYRGATPTKTESGVFLVTARNVRSGWIDYEASMEFVAAKDYATIMRRGLPRIGDLLLTMEAPLGNAALVDREDVALAQRVVRFRFASDRLVPKFALLSVLSAYFQNQLLRRGTGSTAVGIKASKLPQLRLLCPPLTEQAAIVSQIDDACAPLNHGIERTRREIDLLREYGVRLVADVVTGKLDVRAAASQLPDEVDETALLDDLEAGADGDVSEDEADLDGAAREVEV
jgi:type I restriction enzyme, S subunit